MNDSIEAQDQPPVRARLARIQDNVGMQKAQSERAANAIAQYIHVVLGLRGHVPEDRIHAVAATLTAGIVARDQNGS